MNLKLNEQGLIPAIVQDTRTQQVLMLGYVNPASLKHTLEKGEVWFYSRSRQSLWHKGEVSGNFLSVNEVYSDCDNDTILIRVTPSGPVCHTGNFSCFFTSLKEIPQGFDLSPNGPHVLNEVYEVIRERQQHLPEGSYTTKLLRQGVDRVAQKLIEEAGEAALAAAKGDKDHLPSELADLFYHALVLLAASGLHPDTVWKELSDRRQQKNNS